MRTREIFESALLLVGIVAIASTIVIVIVPSSTWRVILGSVFILFLPGYVVSIALFPRKSDLEGFARLAMSFGLSIAVSAFVGLILNYTPWGITLYPILISLGIFTVVTLLIAWQRQRRLAKQERFAVSLALPLTQWKGKSHVNRILLVILIVTIMSAIGALAYGFINPRVETFTEFYILGSEGRAAGYPEELFVGEPAKVTVVIVNHEHENTSYTLEIVMNGKRIDKRIQVELDPQEKWEREVSFTLVEVGKNRKVEFVLYKGDEPYRRLRLWIDVKQ